MLSSAFHRTSETLRGAAGCHSVRSSRARWPSGGRARFFCQRATAHGDFVASQVFWRRRGARRADSSANVASVRKKRSAEVGCSCTEPRPQCPGRFAKLRSKKRSYVSKNEASFQKTKLRAKSRASESTRISIFDANERAKLGFAKASAGFVLVSAHVEGQKCAPNGASSGLRGASAFDARSKKRCPKHGRVEGSTFVAELRPLKGVIRGEQVVGPRRRRPVARSVCSP